MGPYPGSTTELRILEKQDGTQIFQFRYTNLSTGYQSQWFNIPIVKEKK